MKPQKVYLDTSVISAYFDERAPDRRSLTRRFWEERLPELSPLISDLVVAEIQETRDEHRREEILRLVRLSTRREVNLLNSLLNYGPLEILAPPEL